MLFFVLLWDTTNFNASDSSAFPLFINPIWPQGEKKNTVKTYFCKIQVTKPAKNMQDLHGYRTSGNQLSLPVLPLRVERFTFKFTAMS